jgi:RNA polymerase sigma-70 factor (ECF subfamily)
LRPCSRASRGTKRLQVAAALQLEQDPGRRRALVSSARHGDRSAFGALYQEYGRLVHGVLLAYVPFGDAQDLVQDVFVQAMERIGSLRDDEAFGGWLSTIARNRAKDFHRSRKRWLPLLRDFWAGPACNPDSNRALEAIRELPECYRETLTLRFVEGMTGPEIAERTGLTHDSVRVNLHRGMKLLRERFNGEKYGQKDNA